MNDFQIIFKPTEPTQAPPDLSILEQEFQSNDWPIPEAFLCLILCAAYADHQLAEEEKIEIAALIRRSRTMKRFTQKELADMNQTVVGKLRDRKDALREACQALPMDMRPSIFAHCMDIVLADGQLLKEEADYLNQITTYLGLAPEVAQQIQRVVLTKNRY